MALGLLKAYFIPLTEAGKLLTHCLPTPLVGVPSFC